MQRKIIIDEADTILITLSRHGKLSLFGLREKSRLSNQTIYNNVKRLRDMGLIREELEEAFPRRRLITLTETGAKIAKLLDEVNALLPGREP